MQLKYVEMQAEPKQWDKDIMLLIGPWFYCPSVYVTADCSQCTQNALRPVIETAQQTPTFISNGKTCIL